MVRRGNLFDDLRPARGERFDTLLEHRRGRIVRIQGGVDSAKAFVQDDDEFVVLVRGEATLEVQGESLQLEAGDHVFVPKKTPHSLLRSSDDALWLAVHLD